MNDDLGVVAHVKANSVQEGQPGKRLALRKAVQSIKCESMQQSNAA
ncbi:hypothetical protein [Bradyrhizobium sp. CB3481]|nr:hypothetical protein [Bradyrhizobium sp. CB3481]WFU14390.1 hypothetical protein QA643_24705 [Bradyrhizobium sp. CB3481]